MIMVTGPVFRDVADSGNPLPSAEEMERLAKSDPVSFVQECIRRYDREVQGYTVELSKQERLEGHLHPREVMDVAFREKPFSVLMRWREGTRRASAVLYVKGENRDQILVRPAGLLSVAGIVARDPKGAEARNSGRYPLTEFGIKIGMQRTLASWDKAKKANALHVQFLGVKKITELGDRPCCVLRRRHPDAPTAEGVIESNLFFDKDSWLQVGTLLKGKENKLIGEYFFRNIKINADFPDDTFRREALKR